MRLFYAIGLWGLLDLSHLRSSMGDVRELRWVSPDKVHVTLNFLGEVDDIACQEAVDKLREVASDFAPFTLEWGPSGSFPEGKPPRVLWVGLIGQSADLVSQMSIDLGNRQPAPHVTVARVKGLLPREITRRWESVECTWPSVQVTQIQLVESRLTPTGPIYHTVASERLKG